jgi:SAM-dependent methyltransferase
MKCNLCNAADTEIIFDYTRFEKRNVLKCKNCGLVFLAEMKAEDFYDREYRHIETLPERTAEELFNNPIARQDCANRSRWIKDNYGSLKGKKVLEIGSSSGYFLQVLKEEGAREAVGVELTEEHSEYSRKLCFTIYSKPMEDIGFKNEFDLIVTFHTMEHVTDPMAVFKSVKTALKDGGAFMGDVPNEDDWSIKIFDNYIIKRFHYDPCHNYYFAPGTMREYFKRAGLKNVKLETVDRYNLYLQLKRILSGEYDKGNVEQLLKRDVFAKPKDDVRLQHEPPFQETEFNRLFGQAVNNELMGNCLRWMAKAG